MWCLQFKGYNARRLLEPDDGELENNQSDCVSNSRKEAPSGNTHDKVSVSLTFNIFCSFIQVDVTVS